MADQSQIALFAKTNSNALSNHVTLGRDGLTAAPVKGNVFRKKNFFGVYGANSGATFFNSSRK